MRRARGPRVPRPRAFGAPCGPRGTAMSAGFDQVPVNRWLGLVHEAHDPTGAVATGLFTYILLTPAAG